MDNQPLRVLVLGRGEAAEPLAQRLRSRLPQADVLVADALSLPPGKGRWDAAVIDGTEGADVIFPALEAAAIHEIAHRLVLLESLSPLAETCRGQGALVLPPHIEDRALASIVRSMQVAPRADLGPAILVWSAGGRLRGANESARAMLGVTGDAPMTGHVTDFVVWPRGVEPEPKSAGQNVSLSFRLRGPTGDAPSATGSLFQLSGPDSDRVLMFQRAGASATIDGLAEYESFAGSVRRCIGTGQTRRTAVVVADVDGFGLINDSLGAQAGDAVLEEVADRLRRATRATDVVHRLPGDEFGLVLRGISALDGLDQWQRRIRAAFRIPIRVADREVFVTLSSGVAFAGADRSPRMLIASATLAMRRARAEGPGTIRTFEPAMRALAVRSLRLRTALRRALDRGDLRVHYQPIVAVETGRPIGFEALSRWNHGELGTVPPSTFVPVAEQAGWAQRLDELVLERSCLQAARWAADGLARPGYPLMHVNVSARHFTDDSFARRVRRVLLDTSLAPEQLCLEITEGAFMNAPEAAAQSAEELRRMGVGLAIDDFGTGYSSLRRLVDLPVDQLKIDATFIQQLTNHPEAPVVRTILALARELGLRVVAEGVETAEQLGQLSRMGCAQAQGYLFCRPAPADVATRFLETDGRV